MDLHRTTFKMESSSFVPSALASPALMVLASTAESGRDASIPCRPPRPLGVPLPLEKDLHLPYTFASMYQRQGGFPPRDFSTSLLHLHPQFSAATLDCPPLAVLSHGAVGAFRPFPSPEERDSGGYQSAFLPTKRVKGCLEADASPHLRYTDPEAKDFDFVVSRGPPGSPAALKAAEDAGRKMFGVAGLLMDTEASCSPEERKDRGQAKCVFDVQTPMCPVCQCVLRPGELQEHMETEIDRLTHLQMSSSEKECLSAAFPKPLFSALIKREGGSSPRPADEAVHSDRYQTFLRVRANRQTRLSARIGKLKRRKPEEEQRDGVCVVENRSVGAGGEDYEWSEQRQINMVSILRGFRGAVSSTVKESQDSDADLDVDGDDTLSYGKAQYSETDVIPSSRDPDYNEAGVNLDAVDRLAPNIGKWSAAEAPSTSNEDRSKADGSVHPAPTCSSCEIELMSHDSLNTLEALKTRIRDLEKQLTRGDRIKCLICMDSYTIPLTSIQCWHVHCEECWLRTLGAKKLCPQCNTITSPGDLRRVYL